MLEKPNVFDSLARPIRKLLEERGLTEPTLPQQKAIPKILEGKNVLLIAPAGTGKTESAVLPVLHRLLLSQTRERGIKIIYVTPLRALNRDMLERLEQWCSALDLRISVRHGDTAARERRTQALIPPDFLITTPETLQIFLLGRRLREHLRSVRWVIVDEVHELADNKRGAQLSLTLERLRELKGGDFQIIGLSATIGSPEEVARFLVGVDRPCDIIDVSVARELDLDVSYPQPTVRDKQIAEKLYTYPPVAARLRVMKKLIDDHKSTLVFTNTRPTAEVLASRFRLWDMRFPLSVHHGSLSSFTRLKAERGLKQGELKGIICTSSMELGLDIGRVDLVIQYNSPRQVTRL
jgi:ATP-dependent Lhr-like helicase